MQRRALVVEDDLDIVHFVQKSLAAHGFDVSVAPNAREALRMLASATPDVILLDIMMPGMDGTGMLAEIRRRSDLDETRVVMMSAKNTAKDIFEAKRIGADAYLTKPFTIQQLLDICAVPTVREAKPRL